MTRNGITKQTEWGRAAVYNFFFGGAGAALYVYATLIHLCGDGPRVLSTGAFFAVLAPALVATGFLFIALESRHPGRTRHAVRNMPKSWMSVEVFSGALFILFSLAGWFWPGPVLRTAAVLSALVFIAAQSLILYDSKAVLTWHTPLAPVLFSIHAFVAGAALFVILDTVFLQEHLALVLKTVIFLAGMNVVVGLFYFARLRLKKQLRVGRRTEYVTWLAVGAFASHVIPVAIGVVCVTSPGVLSFLEQHGFFRSMLLIAIGASMLTGVLVQKVFVIQKNGLVYKSVLPATLVGR